MTDLALGLDWTPLIPLWAWGVLMAVLLLSVLPLLARGKPGSGMRLLAILALGLGLLDPALTQEERTPLPTIVALVIDDSASQDFGTRRAQTTRAEAALRDALARRPGLEVRTLHVGDAPDGTRLFEALDTALADIPPERFGGAIILSDGLAADVPSGLPFEDAPLHLLLSGSREDFDRRLALRQAPRFSLVGEEAHLVFTLDEEGTPPGGTPRSVPVIVRRDGQAISRHAIRPGEEIAIDVPILHGGNTLIEIEAATAEGELTGINNRLLAQVEGIREALRVLLVSGMPHAGERTWRELLKSDAGVDLVHFTILRPPEKQDGTPISELSLIAFPVRELFLEKIDDFDLIIFDRYEQRGILPQAYYESIARYVRDGGALLVASGPEYALGGSIWRSALAPVLPASPTGIVDEAPFLAEISRDGARHPVTRDLPGGATTPPQWSRWFRQIGADVEHGTVLMHGAGNAPLLVLDRVDSGRSAILLSDQVWLWARGFEGGGPHRALLRRLAHWLMQEPDLEEEALRATIDGERLLIERHSMKETPTEVMLTAPDGTLTTLALEEAAPGIFTAIRPLDQFGLWRVREGALSTLVQFGPINPEEYRQVVSTAKRIGPLSEASHGGIFHLEDGALPSLRLRASPGVHAGADWMALRDRQASAVSSVRRWPLGLGWLGLGLFAGLWVLAWAREGFRRFPRR